MPYYLRHFFPPDFNHTALQPPVMVDGNSHAHYLGYVHNVVAGQTLAELIYLDSLPEGYVARDMPPEETIQEEGEASLPKPDSLSFIPKPVPGETIPDIPSEEKYPYKGFLMQLREMDRRFVYANPVFPQGPNTAPDPQHQNRIISLIKGYCFYHKGLITVKGLLNVRSDVNFQTGNILFINDILVHGSVYPGFRLTGRNIRIKGRIDGGLIRAAGHVTAESGIKGSPTALIEADGIVRVAHCEHARIITPANLIIDGDCMHSELFVGGSLVVKGRLMGGEAHTKEMVYVKESIGNSKGAVTRIALGYDPLGFLHLQKLNGLQQDQAQKLQYHINRARKGPHFAAEAAPFQELATRKLAVIKTMQTDAWRRFSTDLRRSGHTRVIAPGTVHPGVEISIGHAHSKIIHPENNAAFYLYEGNITAGYPALAKHHSPDAGMDAANNTDKTP
ncbi:hypothetical protein FACS1894206_04530 [Deltaproteobacteria bacterium]|nr:hypothetical protein FACS1894206_04530 [Deltaproteobacteria bacterium]